MRKTIDQILNSNEPLNLHLGCGKRDIPGFYNIDRDKFDHIDTVSGIDNLPFVKDGTVDLIYSCHSLEYFDLFEVKEVLKEWHRVLKAGGTLRVSVPDFKKVIEVFGYEGDLTSAYSFIYGRYSKDPNDPKIYHRLIYNEYMLRNVLEESGFKDFRFYDWQKTIHKDYDDYSQAYVPHMDKENGTLMSLNVEVTK